MKDAQFKTKKLNTKESLAKETRIDSDQKSYIKQRILVDKIKSDIYDDLSLSSFNNYDPVWRLTHSFRTTFEYTGQELIKKMLLDREKNTFASYASKDNSTLASIYDEKAFYQRFSELSFFNGSFSSAILAGDARIMLITNLVRALGQSNPLNKKEADIASPNANAIHQRGSISTVTNNWIQSATGIIIDATKGASRILEDLKWLVSCDVTKFNKSKETSLNAVLPFLSTQEDKDSIEKYHLKILELQNAHTTLSKDKRTNKDKLNEIYSQIEILKKGILTLTSTINKKNQMLLSFKSRLAEMIELYTKSQKELLSMPISSSDIITHAEQLNDNTDNNASDKNNSNSNSSSSKNNSNINNRNNINAAISDNSNSSSEIL